VDTACRPVGEVRGRADQDAGKSLQDLNRGITVTALLKPQEVIGADTGEHGDLFTPQARDASQPARGQPDAVGLDELATGPQVGVPVVRAEKTADMADLR